MNVLTISGSRADYGILQPVIQAMRKEFEVEEMTLNHLGYFENSFSSVRRRLEEKRPDVVVILGDRWEILAAVTAAHLQRIPIAHIGGGDVTEGSYDDAMRDCITRMSSLHFVSNDQAAARVSLLMGSKNVHLVGSPGIEYLKGATWRKERPFQSPYVVVAYYPETIDGTNEIQKVIESLPDDLQVFLMPNPDRGSQEIREAIEHHCRLMNQEGYARAIAYEALPHEDFLNLIYHAKEFIGNSSALLYEAPFLGVQTRMIGKRQRGRVIPLDCEKSCERIVDILKAWKP